MKTYIKLLLIIVIVGVGNAANAFAAINGDNGSVARTDTLWPVRTWSICYFDKSFPCELYSDDCMEDECVVKGFTVDEKEHFYIMGGFPTVSIACYEGERQVWKRDVGVSFAHSLYALMKVKGDSLYFFDEERFCLMRIHKDGHGKIASDHMDISPNDSLAWGCVYADRFRLQVGRKQSMGDEYKFTARLLTLDVFFNGVVKRIDEREMEFSQDLRNRMYGGGKGGDVLQGFELEYLPFYVRNASLDTLSEVRLYGGPQVPAVTSACEQIWGNVMPATIFARVGDWLYVPGTLPVGKRFVVRKYNAHVLWLLMENVGIRYKDRRDKS